MLTIVGTVLAAILGVAGSILGPIFTKVESSVIGLFTLPELIRTAVVGGVITATTGIVLAPQLSTLHWLVCVGLIGGVATIATGASQMFTGTAAPVPPVN